MTMLQSALDWSARGFRIFPLKPNGKEPCISNFGNDATDDPEVIRAWWRDPVTGMERDYNIGVLTTDMVVADVDVKNGKPGMDTYQSLGGHFETLTVVTPTGGYHCYFMGPNSSLAPVGPGLDIRSNNGYVVAPGSVIDGVPYQVALDKDMAWVPPGIEQRLRAPGRRADRDEKLIDLDTPTAIDNAIAYVKFDAPLAVEGQRGDHTTYAVACKLVRDYALSEETAHHIMVTHWNERCSPPWSSEELWRKLENASQYATGDLGAGRPEFDFGQVELVEPEVIKLENTSGFGNARDLEVIPQRPWIVPRMLMKRAITLLPAAGSTGKSILTLTIAAHLALGKNIGRYEVKAPCKSVIFNAEDDLEEQSRRLYAICQHYKLDYGEVKSKIMLLSSDDIALNIATSVQYVPQPNWQHINALIDVAKSPDIGMLALDPLVEIHTCSESDNGHMRFVMHILRHIATQANVSMLVPHHTGKVSPGSNVKAGNQDAARGATSIVNSARVVITLFACTDDDQKKFGIPEEDRHRFVRLDDAKMNLTLASPYSVWFKKHGERLYNGDDVGVLQFYDMASDAQRSVERVATLLCEHLIDEGKGSMSMTKAAAILQAADPLYERQTAAQVRTSLERMLREGVDTDFGAIRVSRDTGTDGKDRVTVTLE